MGPTAYSDQGESTRGHGLPFELQRSVHEPTSADPCVRLDLDERREVLRQVTISLLCQINVYFNLLDYLT